MDRSKYIHLLTACVVLGLILFATINIRKIPHPNTVDETLKCAQLYSLKKEQYWGHEIGQNKYIFSSDLNSCLALNIYNDSTLGSYWAMVIDMSNDKSLLYYTSRDHGDYFDGSKKIKCQYSYNSLEYIKNGKEIRHEGCENYQLMDQMFNEIRNFGFQV